MNDLNNPWLVTIFGGIVVTIVATIFFKNKNIFTKRNNIRDNQINNNSTVITNINFDKKESSSLFKTDQIGRLKNYAKILFIDDLDLKDKIKNLMNIGWENILQIKKANNLDLKEIVEADIIFVDYKGIGLSKGQGLDVISALRQRYKDKWLILCSAHDVPVDAFNRGANSYLSKNSSVYEFEQKIIEGLKETNK